MELRFEGKRLLFAFIASAITLVFVQITNKPDPDHLVAYARVILVYLPMLLAIFGLAYSVRIHQLLHQPRTLPLLAMPATVLEKYLFLLLLGAIYYIVVMLITQLSLWAEIVTYGNEFPFNDEEIASLSSMWLSKPYILNPFIIFYSPDTTVFILFILGIQFLIATLVSPKTYAYSLFIVAPAVLMYLAVLTMKYFYKNNMCEGPLGFNKDSFGYYLLSGIGILALIGSYFILRKKPAKQ